MGAGGCAVWLWFDLIARCGFGLSRSQPAVAVCYGPCGFKGWDCLIAWRLQPTPVLACRALLCTSLTGCLPHLHPLQGSRASLAPRSPPPLPASRHGRRRRRQWAAQLWPRQLGSAWRAASGGGERRTAAAVRTTTCPHPISSSASRPGLDALDAAATAASLKLVPAQHIAALTDAPRNQPHTHLQTTDA